MVAQATLRIKRPRKFNSITPSKSDEDADPVPVQVARQPLPQLETALARGPVPPRGRHLRYMHAQRVSLDRELAPDLETACRFDRPLLQQALRIQAVVARGVVDRQPAQP